MQWDLYIAASLKQEGSIERNEAIMAAIKDLELRVFLPQIDNTASDFDIYSRNMNAISQSRNLLFIPDLAGDGVFIEVGFAIGLKIPVIGFSQYSKSAFGRMARGLWESLSDDMKARSHQELHLILTRIFI